MGCEHVFATAQLIALSYRQVRAPLLLQMWKPEHIWEKPWDLNLDSTNPKAQPIVWAEAQKLVLPVPPAPIQTHPRLSTSGTCVPQPSVSHQVPHSVIL